MIPTHRKSRLMHPIFLESAVNKRQKTLPVRPIIYKDTRQLLTGVYVGPTSLETIGAPSTSKAPTPPPPTAADTQSSYAQQLAEVPEFASYGPVLHSSTKPTQLTESETEYQATCVKHIFKEHVVFQVGACTHSCDIMYLRCHSSTSRTQYQTPCWKMSLL